MLRSPLDVAVRDQADREEQEKNLVKAFEKFQEQEINLLAAMVVPPGGYPVNHELGEEEFKIYFEKLKPNEQARFAILLRKMEQAKDDDDQVLSRVRRDIKFLEFKIRGFLG